MRKHSILVTAIGLLLVYFSSVDVQASGKYDRKSLAGINEFQVLVEDLPKDIIEAGLSKRQLEIDVEVRLRTAGIHVVTESSKYLYLKIIGLKYSTGYCYSIYLSFNQFAALIKDIKTLRCMTFDELIGVSNWVKTWDTDTTGFVGFIADPAATIRDGVRERLDTFINDFLAANQEKM